MGQLPGAEGSTIVDQGTYEELVGRGRDLSNILEEQKTKKKETPAESEVCVCVCVPCAVCRVQCAVCVCLCLCFVVMVVDTRTGVTEGRSDCKKPRCL